MAVLRELNLLGQMRWDIPQIRLIESQIRGDFDLAIGTIFAGQQPLIVKGFELTSTSVGAPASSIEVVVAGSCSTNFNATESGSMFIVPSGRANEELSSLNAKVSGAFVASATNYVGMDIRRLADATTSDILQFLNATTLLETSRTVPLGRTLDYRFSISTSDFSSRPHICPIAIVTTDASNNIASVTDARQLAFRLAPGGTFASTAGSYAFPGGRSESTVVLDMVSGDKAIESQHDWMRAAMTRIHEIGGGEFWYSATADRNVTMIWDGTVFSNGENFETLPAQGVALSADYAKTFYLNYASQTGNFTVGQVVTGGTSGATGTISADADAGTTGTLTLTGVVGVFAAAEAITDPITGAAKANGTQYKTLHWKGIKFIFDNSTGYYNDVANQTADSTGLTNLTNGECIYVDLDRTQNLSGANALAAAKAVMSTLGPGSIPGARNIIAWMSGGLVYTRQSRYPVGSIPYDMIPATTTANGILRLTRDYLGNVVAGLSGLNTPTAVSDRGGTITAVAATNHTGLIITGDGTGLGIDATGGATGGTGVRGTGGTNGIGGAFLGVGSAIGVTGRGGAGSATSYGGSFTVQHADGTAVKGVGAGTGSGGDFSSLGSGAGLTVTSASGIGALISGGTYGIDISIVAAAVDGTGIRATAKGTGNGGEFIGGNNNGRGLIATASVAGGSGALITGGTAGGMSVSIIAAAANGTAITATGKGTGNGLTVIGGATAGAFAIEASCAGGPNIAGKFTGIGDVGLWCLSSLNSIAVLKADGHIDMSGSNTPATVSDKILTPQGILRASARFTTTAAPLLTVNSTFGFGTIAIVGGTRTITFDLANFIGLEVVVHTNEWQTVALPALHTWIVTAVGATGAGGRPQITLQLIDRTTGAAAGAFVTGMGGYISVYSFN